MVDNLIWYSRVPLGSMDKVDKLLRMANGQASSNQAMAASKAFQGSHARRKAAAPSSERLQRYDLKLAGAATVAQETLDACMTHPKLVKFGASRRTMTNQGVRLRLFIAS